MQKNKDELVMSNILTNNKLNSNKYIV